MIVFSRVKWVIKGFLCHGVNVLAAVACIVVYFPLQFDNSNSLRHKMGKECYSSFHRVDSPGH